MHPSIFLGAPYSNTSIYQGQLFVTDIIISQVIPFFFFFFDKISGNTLSIDVRNHTMIHDYFLK